MLLFIICCCIASYLIGSLPFGLWIGLLWKGVDIRTLGSKNIGATNVLRVLGPGPGITVFVLDTAKASGGILLARALSHQFAALAGTSDIHTIHALPPPAWTGDLVPFPYLVLIGLFAVLGHTFSIFLGGKGGKGIATSGGVLIALCWQVAVVAYATWSLFVLFTRYVSIGSLAAAYSIPISAYFCMHSEGRWYMFALGLLLSILATVKHRTNIQRLLAGTEPKIGQKVVTPATPEEIIAEEEVSEQLSVNGDQLPVNGER